MTVSIRRDGRGPEADPAGVVFVLPAGYVDPQGVCHREGRMRPATARDEMRALGDFRVHLRPQAFLSVILARVITRLGSFVRVDAGILDRLCARDRSSLEQLYRACNGYPAARGEHEQQRGMRKDRDDRDDRDDREERDEHDA